MPRRSLAVLLGLLLATPALAEESPATDCSKAGAAVEQVICGDFTLSDSEARMAALYDSVRDQLDAAGRAALIQEQADWRTGERDACAEAEPSGEESAEDTVWVCVYQAFEDRSVTLAQTLEAMLDGIEAGQGWSGRYSYDDGHSAGSLTLLRMADGIRFAVSSATGTGLSICDLSGEGLAPSPLELAWQEGEAADACKVAFRRTAAGITVTSSGCADSCGANAYFDADYTAD